MAEITTAKQPKQGKRNVHNTRVDLTPMVDLGFILITFFVFTTTLSQATAMKIVVPKDCVDCTDSKAPETGALTIIADVDKVWYYQGTLQKAIENGAFLTANYTGKDGIGNVITQLRTTLVALNGNDNKMVVMVKALPNSHFKNTIDLLDELTINLVKRGVMMDLSTAEAAYISNQ